MPSYRYIAEYDVDYPFAEGGPVRATYGLEHEWPESPDSRWVPSETAMVAHPDLTPAEPVQITHEGVTVTVDGLTPTVNEPEVS